MYELAAFSFVPNATSEWIVSVLLVDQRVLEIVSKFKNPFPKNSDGRVNSGILGQALQKMFLLLCSSATMNCKKIISIFSHSLALFFSLTVILNGKFSISITLFKWISEFWKYWVKNFMNFCANWKSWIIWLLNVSSVQMKKWVYASIKMFSPVKVLTTLSLNNWKPWMLKLAGD